MVPMQALSLEEDVGDDGEDDERHALLNHLELNQVEGTAIIDESDSVGRYLTAVFEEGDGPTECDDTDEGPVAAYARLLQFQMSVPAKELFLVMAPRLAMLMAMARPIIEIKLVVTSMKVQNLSQC